MSFGGNKTLALLAAACLAGCAGNGNGLDANGNPLSGGATGALTADFQSIQDHVFTPICTRCHIGASAPEGLQLDAAHSYALLVGVPSTEQSNVLRVEPGDPDSSYIIRKLQGTPGISGEQMPLGGPYLPQSTLDVIRQWISAGAQKGSASAQLESSIKSTPRFEVTLTSPQDQSIVADPPATILVQFNHELDSNLIQAGVLALERIDAAGGQPSLPVAVGLVKGNPAALLIEPRSPLAAGTYRLTLHGSLADLNAASLGNDFSFSFTVDVLQ